MNTTTPQLENGYTRIANELLDALCCFRIPGELRQILDTILRKTYGYHKKSDWISNSQIIEATSLLKGNVSRGLSKLITHNIVIKTDNKLCLNKDYYSWIAFNKKVIKSETKVIKTDTVVIKSDNKKLSEVRDTKDNKDNTTKDTLTKEKTHFSKIGDIDLFTLEEIASTYQVPLSFVKSKLDDLQNYCVSKNKRYANYKFALRNWVKKDALKIKQDERSKSKIKFVGDTA